MTDDLTEVSLWPWLLLWHQVLPECKQHLLISAESQSAIFFEEQQTRWLVPDNLATVVFLAEEWVKYLLGVILSKHFKLDKSVPLLNFVCFSLHMNISMNFVQQLKYFYNAKLRLLCQAVVDKNKKHDQALFSVIISIPAHREYVFDQHSVFQN